MSLSRKKLLALVILTLAVSLSGFLYGSLSFRLTGSSVGGDIFPTSAHEVVYFFSKKLDPSSVTKQNISINPAVDFRASVSNNELHIVLLQLPDGNFKIRVNGIRSMSGSQLSLEKHYKVDYVPYDKLSDYEKQKELKQSDSFEETYPVIKILPIYTPKYTIDYQIPASAGADQKLVIIIDVLGVNNNPAYTSEAGDYLIQVRAEARNDLVKQGYDLDSFQVKYAED